MKKYSNVIRGVKGRHARAFYRRETRLGPGRWNTFDALNVKVGDLMNDCDGFNHVVTGIKHVWVPVSAYGIVPGRKGQFLQEVMFSWGEGRRFCHCMPAETVEKISKSVRDWVFSDDTWVAEDIRKKQRDFLDAGGSCCDEQGCPNPAWIELSKEAG